MALTAPTVAANTWVNTGVFADTWGPGATAADTYKIYYTRMNNKVSNIGETVGVSASWYGAECINPTTNAKDPSEQYALVGTRFTGCCGFGKNPSSVMADSQSSWAYLTDN